MHTSPSVPQCSQCTFAQLPPCPFLQVYHLLHAKPFKAFQAFHFAFSYALNICSIHTVRAKIPGDGMLQSPIVACLNNEYPASLSSFDTVLAGCQERTNSATSLNFFYFLIQTSRIQPLNQTFDFEEMFTGIFVKQTHSGSTSTIK